jgi:pteridine reductase
MSRKRPDEEHYMKKPAPVVLITGGGRRIGAEIARHLHAAGYRLALHCRHSRAEAEALASECNRQRPNSAQVFNADLLDTPALPTLVQQAQAAWGRLDALINNASSFYATPMGQIDEAAWEDLVGSNLKAPLFLSQAAAPLLAETRGSIINLLDIHAGRPRRGYSVYSAAKSGLQALTRSLARDLAPQVRVNGVAPGAILWPEDGQMSDVAERDAIIRATPLKRTGTPADIAHAVRFLLSEEAGFITGQVIAVDGGRAIGWA